MRPVMARLAAAFYGYPARDLLMVGVTGTNGKTTVTQLLGDLLERGRPSDQRDGHAVGDADDARGHRGPAGAGRGARPPEVRRPRHAVAMEVSSHALVQSRVEGIHFDVAVFTNLSHDHLDYHGTMEEYFEAKALLFTPEPRAAGVVNADDPWGQRLLEQARIPTVAVHHGDATDMVLRPGHSEFTWRGQRIVTPLTGAVNVDNALLAAEAALALEEPDLGRRRSRGPGPRRSGAGPAAGHRRAGPGGGRIRQPALHRAGRLRPHAGRAGGGARRGAGAGSRGPGALRLRLRREPRPGQAPLMGAAAAH